MIWCPKITFLVWIRKCQLWWQVTRKIKLLGAKKRKRTTSSEVAKPNGDVILLRMVSEWHQNGSIYQVTATFIFKKRSLWSVNSWVSIPHMLIRLLIKCQLFVCTRVEQLHCLNPTLSRTTFHIPYTIRNELIRMVLSRENKTNAVYLALISRIILAGSFERSSHVSFRIQVANKLTLNKIISSNKWTTKTHKSVHIQGNDCL